MKVVKFEGGLGNQMFQYCFYLALKDKFNNVNTDIEFFNENKIHNGFELECIFNLSIQKLSTFKSRVYSPYNRKWIWRKLRRIYISKPIFTQEHEEFQFDNSIFLDRKKRYYVGFWQHIDYIKLNEDKIRKDFKFPQLDAVNEELIHSLHSKETISIHIRRGDYLDTPLLNGICDETYYKSAISYINDRIENPIFVIFSNDIEWCKTKFDSINAIFVDWNTGQDSYKDMQLMSLCKHNIIANSSFSWWGSWLNTNKNKIVISPKKWINPTPKIQNAEGLLLDSFIKL